MHILIYVPYLFAKYLLGSQHPEASKRILLRPFFLIYNHQRWTLLSKYPLQSESDRLGRGHFQYPTISSVFTL